jgi:hypothetical protein
MQICDFAILDYQSTTKPNYDIYKISNVTKQNTHFKP